MQRVSIALLAYLFFTAGCEVCKNMSTTSGVIEMAKPEPPRERVSNETEEQRLANGNTNAAANDARGGHPAYYFLLPLTVPFDIATFPIQAFFYYGLLKGMH
jgi:hypothetical protein